jgi:hypothetical protein
MTRQNGKQTSTTTIIIIGNKKLHNQLLVFVFVLLSGLSKPHHPFFSNNATLSGAFVGCQHSHAGLARLSSAASVHLQLSVEGKNPVYAEFHLSKINTIFMEGAVLETYIST